MIAQPIITSGLSQPLFVTAPPGDHSRLFILEKGGAVRNAAGHDSRRYFRLHIRIPGAESAPAPPVTTP